MNTDQVRDLLTAIHTARSRAALSVLLRQAGDQLLSKLTVRHSIDRLINGLVRDMILGMIGKHSLQCAADLLRRPSVSAHIEDNGIQVRAFDQFASGAATGSSYAGPFGGLACIVSTTFAGMTPQFPAEGTGSPTQLRANGS